MSLRGVYKGNSPSPFISFDSFVHRPHQSSLTIHHIRLRSINTFITSLLIAQAAVMKFSTIMSVLLPTFASATLTYNLTQDYERNDGCVLRRMPEDQVVAGAYFRNFGH